jgi:hypothetical protein
MRLALALAVLAAAVMPPASAQVADIRLPDSVFVSVPFNVDVTMLCPPPDEGPPPQFCNSGAFGSFELSEAAATGPVDPVWISRFGVLTYGPFTFHKPGDQFIVVIAEETQEQLGAVVFTVRQPKGPVPRLKYLRTPQGLPGEDDR